MEKKTFTGNQVLALFSRLTCNGCFKTERDFRIAKQLLTSHLELDYDKAIYDEYEPEIKKVLLKEKNCA